MFLAELVLTYFIQSNLSSHLNVTGPPYIDSEIRLNVEHDFNPKWNMMLSPFEP